jgi:chemotaxis protein histidine kinase CheA
MNLRAKGQEKVEDLSIPDDGSGVDPDKVARKPGQR